MQDNVTDKNGIVKLSVVVNLYLTNAYLAVKGGGADSLYLVEIYEQRAGAVNVQIGIVLYLAH